MGAGRKWRGGTAGELLDQGSEVGGVDREVGGRSSPRSSRPPPDWLGYAALRAEQPLMMIS